MVVEICCIVENVLVVVFGTGLHFACSECFPSLWLYHTEHAQSCLSVSPDSGVGQAMVFLWDS
jgi:hypothetical protein